MSLPLQPHVGGFRIGAQALLVITCVRGITSASPDLRKVRRARWEASSHHVSKLGMQTTAGALRRASRNVLMTASSSVKPVNAVSTEIVNLGNDCGYEASWTGGQAWGAQLLQSIPDSPHTFCPKSARMGC